MKKDKNIYKQEVSSIDSHTTSPKLNVLSSGALCRRQINLFESKKNFYGFSAPENPKMKTGFSWKDLEQNQGNLIKNGER